MVIMNPNYRISEVAEMLGVSKDTLRRWDQSGKLTSVRHPINNYRVYRTEDLLQFQQIGFDFDKSAVSKFDEEKEISPLQRYSVLELFAGAGGLALGLEKAGLHCTMLNELEKDACDTLRLNRPHWRVIEGDVRTIDFTSMAGQVDIVTGGFPCQAFSYAGKRLGFEDARGTLFYEFARAIKETQPLICVGENVRGLERHEGGKTLQGMVEVLDELGYDVIPPKVLKAVEYGVPQKRERLLIVGLKRNENLKFHWPQPSAEQFTLQDALKAGTLYDSDVPYSQGQKYPESKKVIMDLVPPGGYWRDLPVKLQKSYMKGSFHLSGGKTGMARRISWNEPSLTLTCAPAQKQTERCHPDETRPFTVREYARIQTFPDAWQFCGSMTSQYAQIGNAVPVNLGYAVGLEIVRTLNEYVSTSGNASRLSFNYKRNSKQGKSAKILSSKGKKKVKQ
jgi:DNA (cytosine-5)-methyltransferase 1